MATTPSATAHPGYEGELTPTGRVKKKLPPSVRLRMQQDWDKRNGKKPRHKIDPAKQAAANVVRRLALTKHDWEGARQVYISSEKVLTLKDIAEQFGISLGMVRKRAYKERWSYQRVEEQKKAFGKKRRDHLMTMANESISFDKQSADMARLGLAIIAKRLSEIWELMSAQDETTRNIIERLKSGEPIDKKELRSVLYAPELRDLAMSASTFQEMGRKAYGTDIQQMMVDVHGEGGSAQEVTINIAAELGRDDPNRLAGFLEALERTGLDKLLKAGTEEDIIDAEVVNGNGHGPKEIEGVKQGK